ncbi:MAG: cupin domain-containing protein [Vicinamibacterales bacterium]
MKKLVAVVVFVACAVSTWGQQAGPLVDATRLRMQPEAGLDFPGTTLIVAGDPEKPGMYVIRRRFTPGEMSMPHMHDQARYVTVIKGTWWTGEGDVQDRDKTTPVRQGGFMLHPAGLHHYDGAKDEEVIVQIIGMGPVKTTYFEQ